METVMKRLGALLVISLLLGSAARAATLIVVPNKPSYVVGEVITLTAVGDSQGASALFAFGRLIFDNPSVLALGGVQGAQIPLLAFDVLPWVLGPIGCTSNACEFINQISPLVATQTGTTIPLVSTVSFLATGAGTVNASWDVNQRSGFELFFFGLTSAPGTSFTIANPEPGTAGLLGAGLLALAAARRRYTP